MALSDNRRLYDIATRLQLYTEGVKVNQAREFSAVLKQVSQVLKTNLHRVKYRTLDGLSKAELNRLVLTLRESQTKIYSAYTIKLIDQLKEFMSADLEVNRRAWATAYNEEDETEGEEIVSDEEAIELISESPNSDAVPLFGLASVTGNESRIWSQVTNIPIPANGLYLVPFIKTFANSAQVGVENIIRKAWANKWTVEETLIELLGAENVKQGQASQLAKINAQATAVIHTSFAHVAAVGAAAVASALFGRYAWHSIIDGSTTDICRTRNRKVYRFGTGPLPPAHIRCRSHVSPINNTSDIIEETFYTWLVLQPENVQADIMGEEVAEAIKEGRITAKDLTKYDKERPLTLAQFRKKIKEILSR